MRLRRLLALSIAASALTGCSGSSGVEVSRDWSGVDAFVVADVGGLVTVVGIDPGRSQARSLVVVPDRSDDDEVVAPVLARNRAGMTYLARPTKVGSSTLYRVVRGDEAANKVGTLADRSRLYPLADGWAEVSPGPRGSVVRVLGNHLEQRSRLTVPVRPDAVASDGAHGLCLAGNTATSSTVVAVDLGTGRAGAAVSYKAPVGTLACPDGKPLVGVSLAAGNTGDGPPSVRLVDGKVRSLRLVRGRLDSVVIDGTQAYVVAAVGTQLSALVVDLARGTVIRSAVLPGLQAADDVFVTPTGLLVAGDRMVAVFDPGTGKVVDSFALPGRVYPD